MLTRAANELLTSVHHQATARLVTAAQELAELVVVEHLRPAFARTLEHAQTAAAAFGDLDTANLPALMQAPQDVRDAWAELRDLGARVRALWQARGWCNTLSGARPDNDVQGQFALLRDPAALFPDYTYDSPARMPALPVPAEDADLARWLATDATPAQPWLPTLAEQEARWWEVHGESVERMRAGRRAAVAIGGLR